MAKFRQKVKSLTLTFDDFWPILRFIKMAQKTFFRP